MKQEIKVQYRKISDKQIFYNHKFIKTRGEFNNFLDILKSPSKGIWRGLDNALFANYTSLQRHTLIKKDLNSYDDVFLYLDKIFAGFDEWNKGLLVKYFANYNIKDIPVFSKLSFLRHYGVPTPIIDWTRNPSVALYFATENLSKIVKFHSKRYISLYCMTEEHPYYLFDFKKGLDERLKLIPNDGYGIIREQLKVGFHKEFCQSALNEKRFIYNNLRLFPIQKIEEMDTDDFLFYLRNNYNITNQEGLFMINLHPNLPFEQAIFERVKEQTNDIGLQNDALNRCRENLLCYDISVKFLPEIKSFLSSIGINRDFIYPDLNRLKSDIAKIK